MTENEVEQAPTNKLEGQEHTLRNSIRDRAALERNFRGKFDTPNRVGLTDGEFQRLFDGFITSGVFTAARMLFQESRHDSWRRPKIALALFGIDGTEAHPNG